MPALKIVWLDLSKQQFEELRRRAVDTNRYPDFVRRHNEIVGILRDLDRATQRGDPLFHTNKPGGVVYHFLHDFISVTYAIFAQERVGWVMKYLPVPASWPELD